MIDVTESLAPERAALLALLTGCSAADWERPTECPAWTVQGLALHILGDDLSLLSRQRDATEKQGLILFAESHPGLSFRELLDGFNEQWVHAARFLSPALIIELLRLVGEWSDDFYRTVGLDTVSREPVGFFAATDVSPYWQVIAREYVERFVHQHQLRRALGAPDLSGDLVEAAARVSVHALARWLPPLGADAIAVELEGVGAWTWARAGDTWTVTEGPAAATTAVSVAAGSVVALLSRGLDVGEIPDVIRVTGDRSVAAAAQAAFAPFLGRPTAEPRPFG